MLLLPEEAQEVRAEGGRETLRAMHPAEHPLHLQDDQGIHSEIEVSSIVPSVNSIIQSVQYGTTAFVGVSMKLPTGGVLPLSGTKNMKTRNSCFMFFVGADLQRMYMVVVYCSGCILSCRKRTIFFCKRPLATAMIFSWGSIFDTSLSLSVQTNGSCVL